MTPQEKALDLIVKFENIEMILEEKGEYDYYPSIPGEVAKKAAMICVDEIIPCTWKLQTYKRWTLIDVAEETTTEYWNQVKIELQKL